MLQGDDDDEDDEAEPGLTDYIMHYLTLPWKVSYIKNYAYCDFWGPEKGNIKYYFLQKFVFNSKINEISSIC